MVEGLFKFHETFRLVYLLRSVEDVKRETGKTLPTLIVEQLKSERHGECDKVYDPHNRRTVRLSGDLTNCVNEHGDIIELICVYDDCDFTIKLGDTSRPTPKSPHK